MTVLIFIAGLCCGSFVNMLVYRTAKRYGIKIPNSKNQKPNNNQSPITNYQTRSCCDYCGRQLGWYENIPVISWLVQKGKSRCCQKKLPVLYPIVELGTGMLFLLNFKFLISNFQINSNVQFLNFFLNYSWLYFVLGMVVMTMLMFSAVFDAKYMILPDFSIVILIIAAGMRLVIEGQAPGLPLQKILSAGAGAGFLGFLYLITKGKGMGLGDVKLAVFMGLWLGWPKIVVAFYIAFIVGAVVGVILMARKKLKRKSLIAFGPFLILGTMVASFWGSKLISNFKFLIFK